MDDARHAPTTATADELLRRALLDPEAAAAVALKVDGLALADALTVVFHGRRDLGTIQTYVAHGGRGAGRRGGAPPTCCASRATSTSARPTTATRPRTPTPSRRARCATRSSAADTVLAVWREPLRGLVARARVTSTARSTSTSRCPAHRLMPVALVAPERRLTVVPVCGARTLAEGRPPMGIACAQQDVAHVYPLPDDPERCLEDFAERAAEHARQHGRPARAPGA